MCRRLELLIPVLIGLGATGCSLLLDDGSSSPDAGPDAATDTGGTWPPSDDSLFLERYLTGDIDDDGVLDLVLISSSALPAATRAAYVLRGPIDLRSPRFVQRIDTGEAEIVDAQLARVHNTNRLDLVLATYNDGIGEARVYQAIDNPEVIFAAPTTIDLPPDVGPPLSLRAGNFDGGLAQNDFFVGGMGTADFVMSFLTFEDGFSGGAWSSQSVPNSHVTGETIASTDSDEYVFYAFASVRWRFSEAGVLDGMAAGITCHGGVPDWISFARDAAAFDTNVDFVTGDDAEVCVGLLEGSAMSRSVSYEVLAAITPSDGIHGDGAIDAASIGELAGVPLQALALLDYGASGVDLGLVLDVNYSMTPPSSATPTWTSHDVSPRFAVMATLSSEPRSPGEGEVWLFDARSGEALCLRVDASGVVDC